VVEVQVSPVGQVTPVHFDWQRLEVALHFWVESAAEQESGAVVQAHSPVAGAQVSPLAQ
jgi:hypothetical protein